MTEAPTMDELLADSFFGRFRCTVHSCATSGSPSPRSAISRPSSPGASEDKQYTFLYAAAPLKVHLASGSPVNPLAIK